MCKRDVLFAGLILAGLLSLGGALFPPALPARVVQTLPAADDFKEAVERVDAAVRSPWEGLQPAPLASELAIARRLGLALTGSIPSLQEIRQLEACAPEGRLDGWLAGLLEDRRCADYLAERLARAYVGTEDGPFLLYRRRRFVSWLSDELMQNRPYDALVRALITASGLWTDSPATNFLTVTANPAMSNRPDPERLAGRVARAFLAIRLDCAQCHNHPYEEWKQVDFRGLAAFFGQVREGFRGAYDGNGELELPSRKTLELQTIAPRVPFLPELLPSTGSRRQQLAAWVTHPANTHFAPAVVNRVWAWMFGRPLVDPVDDLAAEGIEAPPVLQVLADDFVAHGYDLRRLIRVIAASEAFRLDSAAVHEIGAEHDKTWAAFPLTRLRPEQVAGALLQAAALETLDADTPLLFKLVTAIAEREFVQRYGDTGEDELGGRGGTIPQRLLLMNGSLVHKQTKQHLFNAATRIGWLAPDDGAAVRTAYLAVLTRTPTPEELQHFETRLGGSRGEERSRRMEDLYWALINATEFSWNH